MSRFTPVALTVPVLCVVLVAAIVFQRSYVVVIDRSEISISRTTGDREYAGEPFTGLAVSYHSNGILAKEEAFLNGRRHGYVKHWFESGALGFASTYQAGRREGLATSWWGNGNKRSETLYVNDQISGISWRWYKTGEKFKRFNYLAGKPTGLQQAWRSNGKLFSNFEYKNGRVYGLKKANVCFGLEDEEVLLN
jgi:antitoxin component YwqK of YwqJK toxin-antitoxin module